MSTATVDCRLSTARGGLDLKRKISCKCRLSTVDCRCDSGGTKENRISDLDSSQQPSTASSSSTVPIANSRLDCHCHCRLSTARAAVKKNVDCHFHCRLSTARSIVERKENLRSQITDVIEIVDCQLQK